MSFFSQNTQEASYNSMMIQGNQHNQCSEVPHFKVLDLFKRLMHKDDLLQCYYYENQHLKMLMNKKEACQNPIRGTMSNQPCTQHAAKDPIGNAHVRHQEHKKTEEE